MVAAEKTAVEGVIQYCDRRIAAIDRGKATKAEASYWEGMRVGFLRCRAAAIREMEVRA